MTLKENVRIQIEYPEGYEFVRYGRAVKGEFVLSENRVYEVHYPKRGKYFILKKIER